MKVSTAYTWSLSYQLALTNCWQCWQRISSGLRVRASHRPTIQRRGGAQAGPFICSSSDSQDIRVLSRCSKHRSASHFCQWASFSVITRHASARCNRLWRTVTVNGLPSTRRLLSSAVHHSLSAPYTRPSQRL
jgi:hypothetical protein